MSQRSARLWRFSPTPPGDRKEPLLSPATGRLHPTAHRPGLCYLSQTGRFQAPFAPGRSAVPRFLADQRLPDRRGVIRMRKWCSSNFASWPSIHPQQSAASMASSLLIVVSRGADLGELEPKAVRLCRFTGACNVSMAATSSKDRIESFVLPYGLPRASVWLQSTRLVPLVKTQRILGQ